MAVRVRYRFLLGLLTVSLLTGGAVYGLHRYQLYRNATAFLTKARAERESGKIADAITYYQQFLGLNPNDAEARAELADIYRSIGNFEGEYLQLEQALRLDGTSISLKKAMVKSAMTLGRNADARGWLEKDLLPVEPDNAELHWLMGLCANQLNDFDLARSSFEKAVSLDPKDPKFAGAYATFLSDRVNQREAGEGVMGHLVAQAPDSSLALLTRAQWLFSQSMKLANTRDNTLRQTYLATAWEDLSKAHQLAPEDVTVLLVWGEVANAARRTEEFRPIAMQAMKENPGVPELYTSLAQIEIRAGKPDEALLILREGYRLLAGSFDLAFNLAQLELQSGNLEAGKAIYEDLLKRQIDNAPMRLLEARVLASDGEWRKAADVLERSRALFDRTKDLLKQVDILLSVCYRNLGNPDQEMEALRRGVSADPMWEFARESLAGALVRSGRIREAIAELTQLVNQPTPSVTSVLLLARLQFIDGLGRNLSGSGWDPLRQVLQALAAIPEAKDDLVILQAELDVVEGDKEKARADIESRIAESPTVPALYQALISLDVRNEDWDSVDKLIQQAASKLGDSPTIRLERARYLVRRYGKEVSLEELDKLSVPDPSWSEADQNQLAAGFAATFLTLEDYARSKVLAEKVASSSAGKTNLSVHLLLFELAFRSEDLEGMQASLARVQTIEGSGPLWRFGEAMRLCVQAVQEKSNDASLIDPLYDRALEQLAEAVVLRPNWSRIPRLKAEIFERRKRTDLAVQNYLEAIRLGEQSPQVVSRAILLLFEKGRYVEADEVVRKLQEQKTPFSSELTRVASQVSLELENFDRALSLANEWALQSDQQEDHVWLAQILSISGNTEKASQEFEIAIGKDPTNPSPWIAFIQMLARNGKGAEAEQLVTRAAEAIRKEDRDDALAQAYQSLKNFDKAKEYYDLALEARGESASLRRRYAEFYLNQNDPAKAESSLQFLVTGGDSVPEEDRSWARRSLALLSGLRGGDENVQRAKDLLGENKKSEVDPLADDRVLAAILANQAKQENQLEAIRIMERVARESPKFSRIDNFLLADLYKRSGEWAKYTRTMRSVLANGGAEDAETVQSYAQSLVDHGDLEEGQLWFDRLKALAPQELSTATIEAQLYFQSKDYDRLAKLIESRGKSSDGLGWGAELSELSLRRLASEGNRALLPRFEKLYDDFWTAFALESERNRFVFACSLCRRGKVEESIEQLKGMSLTADQLNDWVQSGLQASAFDDEKIPQVIAFVQAAIPSGNTSPLPFVALGDLWSWVRNGREASVAYQAALKLDPNQLIALNNLAMVNAMTGGDLELSNRSVDQAMKLIGETEFLLDTRGLVHLAAKRYAEAEVDFRKSMQLVPRGDKNFHLAQALLGLGRREDAKSEFAKAVAAGASDSSLHPLERDVFRELSKVLR